MTEGFDECFVIFDSSFFNYELVRSLGSNPILFLGAESLPATGWILIFPNVTHWVLTADLAPDTLGFPLVSADLLSSILGFFFF